MSVSENLSGYCVRWVSGMNDYDLDNAARRYDPNAVPNRANLTKVVSRLMAWTNQNSDGWAYWPKPVRAAARAMELIESTTNPENERREREDASDAETVSALRPIKSFLTRMGVDHSTIIG